MISSISVAVVWSYFLAGCSGFTAETQARVTIAVQKHYRSGCVFLLSCSDRQSSERDVATAVVSVRTLQNVSCPQNRPLFVVLPDHEDVSAALGQMSHQSTLSSARWLLFLNPGQDPIEDFFRDVYVPFDCEMLVAQLKEPLGIMSLTEVYHVSAASPLVTAPWGCWSAEKGLEGPTGGLYRRRRDLQGLVITATARHYSSDVEFKLIGGRQVVVGGYAAIIWSILQRSLNFTLKFIDSNDKSWGLQLKNGSWNGPIGLIARGEAEFSVNTFGMTPNRTWAIDYSQPMLDTRATVFLPRQPGMADGWSGVLAPFRASLWLALVIAVPVLAAFLSFLQFFSLRNVTQNIATGPTPLAFQDFLYQVINIYSLQGINSVILPRPCRVLVVAMYLLALVLSTAFCCKLISYLTVQKMVLPFSTFQGLLDDGSYQLGVVAEAYHYDIFQRAKNPVLQKVFVRLLEPKKAELPTEARHGLQRVCSEANYAFFASQDIAQYSSGNLSCALWPLPHTELKESWAYLFRKQCPYRGLFTTSLENIRHAGLLRLLQEHIWPAVTPVTETTDSSVAINNVSPFFSLLALGVMLALLVVLLERCQCVQRQP